MAVLSWEKSSCQIDTPTVWKMFRYLLSLSRSCSSARLRSVTSLLVSSTPAGRPSSARCSDQRLATTTCAPARVVWTSSPSHRPVRRSSDSISWSGAGNTVRISRWETCPTASALAHP